MRSQRRAGTMPQRRVIYAFYEGESERQYLEQVKVRYQTDRKSIIMKIETRHGLFKEAVNKFQKDCGHRKALRNGIDEIWFCFDTHDTDGADKTWEHIFEQIQLMRKWQKGLIVRLLMTTGCFEYWLMLHFKRYAPTIQTKEQRQWIEHELDDVCQKSWDLGYKKGDAEILHKIVGGRWETAVSNGSMVLQRLCEYGLPTVEDTDERDQWLLKHHETFTTVHKAIQLLDALHPFPCDHIGSTTW